MAKVGQVVNGLAADTEILWQFPPSSRILEKILNQRAVDELGALSVGQPSELLRNNQNVEVGAQHQSRIYAKV